MMERRIREAWSYDPVTGKIIWLISIPPAEALEEAGSLHSAGYKQLCLDQTMYLAHRVAWFLYYGEWPKENLDHIDGDRLNNKITNLRIANKQQNAWNRLPRKNVTSLYKGVSWDKVRNKWAVYIKVDGKVVNLGRYLLEEDAAEAYNKAAIAHFNGFGRLNIVHPAISTDAIMV